MITSLKSKEARLIKSIQALVTKITFHKYYIVNLRLRLKPYLNKDEL